MLNSVMKWCNMNKLTVNIDKTKCMVLNPLLLDDATGLKIYVDNIALSQVHVYEYLSVKIDEQLNMSSQLDNVCKKVQQKYGILRIIWRYITQETELSI